MIRQFGVQQLAWQTSPTQNCPWLLQSKLSVLRTPDYFLITFYSFSSKCLSQYVIQYLPVCILIWCLSPWTTGYTRAESSCVLITALHPATRKGEGLGLSCWINEWTHLLCKIEFSSNSCLPSSLSSSTIYYENVDSEQENRSSFI